MRGVKGLAFPVTILLVVIAVLIHRLHDINQGIRDELEVGQVWVYDYDKNPFKNVRRDTMRIVDIKGDYVQYELRGKLDSSDKYLFKIGSRRIK